jgi:septal ring factor EnvC (AmiA/AmiB activator)
MRQAIFSGFLMILWMLAGLLTHAQSLDELRKKKFSASEEIRYTNELLGKVNESQKATLGKLRLLNKQIEQRNRLISVISSEVSLLQMLIDDNNTVVEILTSDLEKIRQEYAQMVRFAWKNRNTYDKILFFLSAKNFNEAFRRYVYFRQYAEYRVKQTEIMASLQTILTRKLSDLQIQHGVQQSVMTEKVKENRKLTVQKKQQDSVAKDLQKKKSDLQKKLAQQRSIELQLAGEIQKIIDEETKKAVKSGKPGFTMTPEQELSGSNFEQNRKRLPWPVEKGVITERFGVHAHPVLEKVTVNNNGISIATEPGTKARAVFNGEITRVFGITGGNMAVIIRHGHYLTVYSNIVNVMIKKGDKISIRQNLGTIYSDPGDDNKTILKFQIWKESQKLDPEDWLVR